MLEATQASENNPGKRLHSLCQFTSEYGDEYAKWTSGTSAKS